MSKHTVGPWKAVQGIFWTIEALDGQRVANTLDSACLLVGPEYHDYSEANARLIAAAPDLLAALEALFSDYKQLADSGDAGNWRLEDMDVGRVALAAIASAKGEQV